MKRRTASEPAPTPTPTPAIEIPMVLDLVDGPGLADSPEVHRLRVAIAETMLYRAELWQTDPRSAALLERELVRKLFPVAGGVA